MEENRLGQSKIKIGKSCEKLENLCFQMTHSPPKSSDAMMRSGQLSSLYDEISYESIQLVRLTRSTGNSMTLRQGILSLGERCVTLIKSLRELSSDDEWQTFSPIFEKEMEEIRNSIVNIKTVVDNIGSSQRKSTLWYQGFQEIQEIFHTFSGKDSSPSQLSLDELSCQLHWKIYALYHLLKTLVSSLTSSKEQLEASLNQFLATVRDLSNSAAMLGYRAPSMIDVVSCVQNLLLVLGDFFFVCEDADGFMQENHHKHMMKNAFKEVKERLAMLKKAASPEKKETIH